MFENKIINGYTYATRFIMSWVRSGGTFGKHGEGYDDFRKWLESLELKTEDIEDIMFIAQNGKLELEVSAKKFITNLKVCIILIRCRCREQKLSVKRGMTD